MIVVKVMVTGVDIAIEWCMVLESATELFVGHILQEFTFFSSLSTLSNVALVLLFSTYSQTGLRSTWVSKYSWIVSTPAWIISTHCSVLTSCNAIESTSSDNKYL